MKIKILVPLTAIALLALLTTSMHLAAQGPAGPSHYRVIDLGTLGGTQSSGNAINNLGWATGFSDQAGNSVQLATVWIYGLQLPLGTLGGPSSDVAWPVKNNFGLISGISENGVHDPLNETFSCPVFGFSSGNSCVAFAWQFGTMTQLPGLGGNNSVGGGDNDLGQIVGWAENSFHDPTCAPPGPAGTQVLQFEAVVWQQVKGKWTVRQLPPFGSDPDGAAVAVNNLGQVVGISGQCDEAIGAYSAIHAVLWQDGKPIDLGNLGGHGWNTPDAINNRGAIVGFMNQPGDVVDGSLNFQPTTFLWTKEGGLQNLGTLPGDAISEATDINDEDQIVGTSFEAGFANPLAFIYQNGAMTPLNALIGSASANWDVSSTGGINDRGEIAAQANPVSNGVVNFSVAHAVLLVPASPNDPLAYGETHKFSLPPGTQREQGTRVNMGRFLLPMKPQ